jgi:glycosyltransferase involved in cell wall biosynthesis
MSKKLIRITTVPDSLRGILSGQLKFMSDKYEVIAVSSDGQMLNEVKIHEGVKVVPINMARTIAPFKDLKALIQLYFLFKKEKPLIVHTHTPKAGILGMVASKLAGVPNRLHTVAGLPLLLAKGNRRKVLNLVEKVTYTCATEVFPNSFGLKDIIIENNFCNPSKLKVLANGSSNGVNTRYFDPSLFSENEKNELKSNLGIDKNDLVFIFLGRIVSDKGINEMINAFKRLNNEVALIKLLLVGPLESHLDPLDKKTIKEIESNKNIINIGLQNDVRPYFAIADILVFPSYREGFPNVVMEAGAMGLPSIVSNINGCNEIIKEGENGWIIPVKDEEAIYNKMKYCIENSNEVVKVANNSRELITSRYEQKIIWDSLLEEYQKLEIGKRNDHNKIIKRKKICFVVPSIGSARVFLKNHFKELSINFDIYLVANVLEEELIYLADSPIKEIKHINLTRSISILNDLQSLFFLYTYFKKMKFDAVHTLTPKAGLLGVFASRLASSSNRIHMFTGQVWHTKKGLYKYFLMLLDRFTVWNATHILVDGHPQRQFLIQNKIISGTNSSVLGKGSTAGVDTNRFCPNASVKKEVRNKLGIKENEVVYMFLGRMNSEKGINELAEAFNSLHKKHANVRLLLVGDDEENMKESIKQKVEDINSVIFSGVTTTPEHFIQACDVFCMPSHREGFPLSVLEASSVEKPIICSDTYGLMESIVENKTGIRHKVADVDSLHFAMEKLFYDQNLVESLGKGGRAYVLENFTAKTITEKWVEFYLKMFNV